MSAKPVNSEIRGETRFYRPAYEGISALAWFAGALIYIAIGRIVQEGIGAVSYAAIPMLMLAAYNANKVWKNWMFKTHLSTPRPPWIAVKTLFDKQRNTGKTFIGKGFEWEPSHARIMKEISTIPSVSVLEPPEIFRHGMVFLGLAAKDIVLEGKHYIHGCGGYEEDLFVTDQSRRSHTLVLGTNGAGKTRALESIVAQSIRRGELTEKEERRFEYEKARAVPREQSHPDGAQMRLERLKKFGPKFGPVFILDPKGDIDLRDRAYATAKYLGREKKFHYFSPTHENVSFRINPLANYNRTTELANRISALLPSGGDSDAFRQFAWSAINVVVEGLRFAGIPINLLTLRKYIEGGIEELAIECIRRHIKLHSASYPGWERDVTVIQNRIKGGDRTPPDRAAVASALASYYINKVRCANTDTGKPAHRSTTIDGIVDVIEHDAQHYAKLIGNLIPILVQLTSGPMEVLLSDPKSQQEARPQTSFQSLIDMNAIVYINFESLADGVVGSALGSLFLADLTACAAVRHHKGITNPPVSVFVDEAAEMMNDPFIQALNKGRAAGFELTLASQTIADFVARMGNEAKAMQVLGNVNTTIAMRLQDNESIQMVSEKFAETSYEEKTSSKSSTTIAPMAHKGRDFSGSITKNTQTSDLPLVTGDLLSSLPPGHFFGHFPGGRKVKGRVLMMRMDKEDRFNPEKQGHTSFQHTPSEVITKIDDVSAAVEQPEQEVFGNSVEALFTRSYEQIATHHFSNIDVLNTVPSIGR